MPPTPATDPTAPPPAPGRVLSTLNADGSRRSIRPRPMKGAWWRKRRTVAYGLMVVFFVIPYLRMGGKPLILLDIPRREFTVFGTTFLSTETIFFQLLFLAAVVGLFLVTALLGRVWCGWGCPQTVYMEFLFRPIERWFEGGWRGSLALDASRRPALGRIAKHAVYVLLAMFLAHTFLGYFVRVSDLARWVTGPPAEHPTAFLVMLTTTGLIYFDFAWFREQTCLVACPYGRLQSVLLDRRSLIVAYDSQRGEPRGHVDAPGPLGDCVDCGMCVQTCPTGIDIRDGLQMECIHCTQCADACDRVMTKLHRPIGLVGFSSRDRLERRAGTWLRPRVLLYPAALVVTLGLFAVLMARRADSEVTLLRGTGVPFTVETDGSVANQIRVRVTNKGAAARRYTIAWADSTPGTLIAPVNPLVVDAGQMKETSVFAVLPPGRLHGGARDVLLRLTDDTGRVTDVPYRLVGPEPEEAR
jgi:cytochrome c oxidase accessory protein FixG